MSDMHYAYRTIRGLVASYPGCVHGRRKTVWYRLRDCISSYSLKQSRHNYWPHPLCGIESCNRVFEMMPATMQTERDSVTKNFNLYSYIAMKVFPGNYLPGLAIICHCSVVSTI